MLRQHLIKKKSGVKGIRWRLHEPTRIEALTDSVFAFAVTLIVISLEVPQTFKELIYSMRGFFGFAICFTMLMLIWYEQYLYFRKYGLQDLKTIFLNAVLLFIVLFYVYPLKFLFGFLTLGNTATDASGKVIYRFTANEQISELMIIYGCGFVAIYLVFLLMYHNAYKKGDKIQLNELELFNTRTNIYDKTAMICIGLFSISLSVVGIYLNPWFGMFAGISYALIAPALTLLHSKRKKLMKEKFTQEEIDQINDEIVIIEKRKVDQKKESPGEVTETVNEI